MAENPSSVCDSAYLRFSCEVELDDLDTQKKMAISSDHEESFLEENPESDSFVVDLGSLSNSYGGEKDITTSSRITVKMPRSLSRKGSQIGERTTTTTFASGGVADGSSNGNKTTATSLAGGCNAERFIISPTVLVETKEPPTPQAQAHQINITGESKCRRLYSRQRSFPARLINPSRVLFFFATLSSMGTIILIYFTLSIGRLSGDNSSHAQM